MRPADAIGNVRLLGLFNFLGDFRLFGPILIIYFAELSGSYVLGSVICRFLVGGPGHRPVRRDQDAARRCPGCRCFRVGGVRFTDVVRATMGSLGQFLGSLCYGVFAVVAGLIADAYSPQAALLAVHVASLTTIPVYWWLHTSRR